MNKQTAAKYSFLLSIPAILGAAVLEIKDIVTGETIVGDLNFVALTLGFVAAMLSGYLAINFMLALINKCKLRYFSYYVFGLAFLLIIDNLFIHFI